MTALITFLVAFAAGAASGQVTELNASPGADGDSAGPLTPAGEESVAALVRRLASADYTEREEADERLRTIGMAAVEELARAYCDTDDFETRIRIQRIVEQVFFWDRVLGKNAFLGIQHTVYIPPGPDPRIPQGRVTFEIRQVIPGTAADRAGLRSGDIILSVDGNTLPQGADARAFADLIRFKLPGTPVAIEFFRGDARVVMQVALGHRPLRHYGSAAPTDLNSQLEAAVQEFPGWWVARFGSPLPDPESDGRDRDPPLFLELPSDYGRR